MFQILRKRGSAWSGGGYSAETLAYKARVEADGGTVVSLDDVETAILHAKANGYYSNITGWYSSQFGYKDAGSGAVSKIYDLSPNNYDLSQATSSAQPSLVANQQNGRAWFSFDGGDYLTTTGHPEPSGVGARTDVFVGRFADQNGKEIFSQGNNENGHRWAFGWITSTEFHIAECANISWAISRPSVDTMHVIIGTFSGGDVNLSTAMAAWVDGVSQSRSGGTDRRISTDIYNGFTLGGLNTIIGYEPTMKVCEIMILDDDVDATVRASIESRTNTMWDVY